MNCHPRRRPRISGFTLFEVMMAAMVLALALTGMIQVVVSGTEMIDVARKQTIAAQMIRTEIDRIHQLDWNTVTGWTGYYKDNTAAPVEIDSLTSASYFGYPELLTYKSTTKTFKISRLVSAGPNNRSDMRTITFTVTWTGRTGRTYSRFGKTYFGQRGLTLTYQNP